MDNTATQRGKPQSNLRDFSSPVLKSWRTQRLTRDEGGEGNGEGVAGENRSALPSPARDFSRRFSRIGGAPKIGCIDDDGGLEELQEKLMGHLRQTADRIKRDVPFIKPASSVTEQELMPSIPWNLRKRRAQPLREAERNIRLRFEIKEKKTPKKFSVSISKEEIEEDVFALTGSRPCRRPKKRPRNVQRVLDLIFPGLLLSEITPELYKVSE